MSLFGLSDTVAWFPACEINLLVKVLVVILLELHGDFKSTLIFLKNDGQ